MIIAIKDDYVNHNGELVPIDNVDTVHRQDLIDAFDKLSPAFDDNKPLFKLALGIITVVFLIITLTLIGA